MGFCYPWWLGDAHLFEADNRDRHARLHKAVCLFPKGWIYIYVGKIGFTHSYNFGVYPTNGALIIYSFSNKAAVNFF